MVYLTDEERQKFAVYCRQCADSLDGIIMQMEKLPGIPQEIMNRQKNGRAAYRIIANEMVSGETDTISG